MYIIPIILHCVMTNDLITCDLMRRCSEGEVVVEQVPGVFLRQQIPYQPDAPHCSEEMCKQFGCREREMQICSRAREGRDCARTQLLPTQKEEEKDHEAHTESLILQRETMRHLTDWFYPDGGWGWTVVVVAILINLVALGPLLGGGQVLV